MVATAIKTNTVEAQAQAIAEVMENNYVFGRPGTDYAFYEKHDFVGMVTRHSKEVRPGELEITYRNSDVRVIITTQVVENVASINTVRVFNHPKENPSIDFEELNEIVQEII